MSSFQLPGLDNDASSDSNVRKWRWVVLLAAGLIALFWAKRTVISNSRQLESEFAGEPDQFIRSSTDLDQPASDRNSPAALEPPADAESQVNDEITEAALGLISLANDAPAAPEIEAGTTTAGTLNEDSVTGSAATIEPPDRTTLSQSEEIPTVEVTSEAETSSPRSDSENGTTSGDGWIKSDGNQHCPEAFPIKGNASSRIFHRPGESSYERTVPEFCFADDTAAIAKGFRPRNR